jgi:diguanylate cyclase (GGDEF)-like protein
MVDVDHFKRFNDTHGHQAGDEVLKQVASALRGTMRDMDVVARYGGEEFALILPGTGLHDAQRAAERARAAVAAVRVAHQGKELRVTASLGTAQAMPGDEPATLVSRADQALYASKQAGRDRVYFHSGSLCLPIELSDDPQPPAAEDRATMAVALAEVAGGAPAEAAQAGAAPEGEAPVEEVPAPRPDRRRRARHSLSVTQSVAPFVHGLLPTPCMFRDVQCEDVSSTGFSFFFDEKPTWDAVVVEFGIPPNLMYLSARIVHVTPIASAQGTRFKVGCRFSGKLQL